MYDSIIEHYAHRYNVPELIIRATIQVESGGNPNACRFEPGYIWLYEISKMTKAIGCTRETMVNMQKTSYGIMQVMGAVFLELGGYTEEEESSRWPTAMSNPFLGIKYGSLVLRDIMRKHGHNALDIYSAFNQGSPRKAFNGLYVNQSAVTRFKNAYEKLGGKL